jgi:peptidoglycan L-alanyl-D-glutamate endopeptidase CwlK
MKRAAKDLGIDLEWGGDWKSFPDAPHWQLSHKAYPNV